MESRRESLRFCVDGVVIGHDKRTESALVRGCAARTFGGENRAADLGRTYVVGGVA